MSQKGNLVEIADVHPSVCKYTQILAISKFLITQLNFRKQFFIDKTDWMVSSITPSGGNYIVSFCRCYSQRGLR
jgi:hypothetical protein